MTFLDFVFYIFIFVVCIQVFFNLFFFRAFAFSKLKKGASESIPVSVIICAKNEAHNLPILIPKLLTQDYSTFEIILINDHSIDNTLEIMESFKNVSKLIKIVNVKSNETFWGSKKYALTLGIKKVKTKYCFE